MVSDGDDARCGDDGRKDVLADIASSSPFAVVIAFRHRHRLDVLSPPGQSHPPKSSLLTLSLPSITS